MCNKSCKLVSFCLTVLSEASECKNILKDQLFEAVLAKTTQTETLFYLINLQKPVQYLGLLKSVPRSLLAECEARHQGVIWTVWISQPPRARDYTPECWLMNMQMRSAAFSFSTRWQVRQRGVIGFVSPHTSGAGLQNTVNKTQREREEREVTAHHCLRACYLSLQATAGLMTFSSQTEAELLLRGK